MKYFDIVFLFNNLIRINILIVDDKFYRKSHHWKSLFLQSYLFLTVLLLTATLTYYFAWLIFTEVSFSITFIFFRSLTEYIEQKRKCVSSSRSSRGLMEIWVIYSKPCRFIISIRMYRKRFFSGCSHCIEKLMWEQTEETE